MKRLILICLLSFAFLATHAQTFDSGFVRPWVDQRRALVIDGRYTNFLTKEGKDAVDWDAMAKDPRLGAVILRATGYDVDLRKVVVDPNYQALRQKAKSRGLLWGSFHVGVSDYPMSPRDQADLYLKHIDNDDNELIALDLEISNKKKVMNAADAKVFIQRIFERTGRYPVVYLPGSFHKDILEAEPNTSVFRHTPLWFGRFEDNVTRCMARGDKVSWWQTYALWQFASERNCHDVSKTYCELPERPTVCPYDNATHQIPMILGVTDRKIDVNIFNGTVEELRKKWPFTFKKKK